MKTTKTMKTGGTTKMKMVVKNGKSVPAFAADGKGKMQGGGEKMQGGAKPKAMYGKEIMQKGGSTGKTKKYKTKNSYSELTGSSGNPLKTTVNSPSGNYKKNIELQSYLSDTKKPYMMSVTKGGKTNEFQLSKEQAISQRKKVKKTMGFQKSGMTKKKK